MGHTSLFRNNWIEKCCGSAESHQLETNCWGEFCQSKEKQISSKGHQFSIPLQITIQITDHNLLSFELCGNAHMNICTVSQNRTTGLGLTVRLGIVTFVFSTVAQTKLSGYQKAKTLRTLGFYCGGPTLGQKEHNANEMQENDSTHEVLNLHFSNEKHWTQDCPSAFKTE